MEDILHIQGISKHYGKVTALQEIAFQVSPGEIFGLIGPDGAGKSTLFRILATLLLPDTGDGKMLGFDLKKSTATSAGTSDTCPDAFRFTRT